MSKEKKGFNLIGKVQGVAKSATDAVKEIDISEVKDKIQDTAESAVDAVKDIDLSEVKDKVEYTADSAVKAVKKVKLPDVDIKNAFKKKEKEEKAADELEVTDTLNITAIATRNALKIIYYLIASDGDVRKEEEEKFDSIGKELDPMFADHKDAIVKECKAQLDKVIDPQDYYDTVQGGIEDALITSRETEDSFITPKLLLWNLLTVAFSNEEYRELERKLLKYIVRKTDIDKTVFMEMESSILTLMDVEKELEWIKTTDKPYLTIEKTVNELADRKNVIFESVKDLIAL